MPMTREELLARIGVDPQVCFGKPCIRGHRIWVSLILDLSAGGASIKEILDDYPSRRDRRPGLPRLRCGDGPRSLHRAARASLVRLKLDENLGERAAARLRRPRRHHRSRAAPTNFQQRPLHSRDSQAFQREFYIDQPVPESSLVPAGALLSLLAIDTRPQFCDSSLPPQL